MRTARASGISLWLMPQGEAHDRLAGLIARLAGRFGTVAFPPHVTLLAGIDAPEAEVIAAARALARERTPLPIALTGVGGRAGHFRCLFLRVEATDALRQAHAGAARRCGRRPDPAFFPHLSLVYGVLAPETKAELADELAAEARVSFESRRLHVWRTEGPVADWRQLAAFALELRASDSRQRRPQ